MDAAVADPPDPVQPANHFLNHTVTRTTPRHSESRRDPVRPTTLEATRAVAGLKAAMWLPRQP
jgi:hypothetical protein